MAAGGIGSYVGSQAAGFSKRGVEKNSWASKIQSASDRLGVGSKSLLNCTIANLVLVFAHLTSLGLIFTKSASCL